MAELLIKVGDRSADPTDYKDGDILCAFNRRRIRCTHAQHICHINRAARNESGLIVGTEIARDFFETTHQYQWERVSANELRRTNLVTGTEIVYGSTPVEDPDRPGRMIHCNVRSFLRRRRQRNNHYIFGEEGAEFFYGGRIDFSESKVESVWDAIESKTPFRRIDHDRWPMGNLDVRHHLPITVDEFDDVTAEELVASDVDETDPENPVIVAKRKNHVDWQNDLLLTPPEKALVLDKSQVFDGRGLRQYALSQIRRIKQRVSPRGVQ